MRWEGVEGTYELVDGQVVALGPCTLGHARLNANLLVALSRRRDRTRYLDYGTNISCELGSFDVRAPDLAIYCDRRDLDDPNLDDRLTLQFPRVLFAVESGRDGNDLDRRLDDYRRAPTVDTIVVIDLRAEETTVQERFCRLQKTRKRTEARRKRVRQRCAS